MASLSGWINDDGQIHNIDVNLNDVRQMCETLPHLNQTIIFEIR